MRILAGKNRDNIGGWTRRVELVFDFSSFFYSIYIGERMTVFPKGLSDTTMRAIRSI
jgi:hypothetical protein